MKKSIKKIFTLGAVLALGLVPITAVASCGSPDTEQVADNTHHIPTVDDVVSGEENFNPTVALQALKETVDGINIEEPEYTFIEHDGSFDNEIKFKLFTEKGNDTKYATITGINGAVTGGWFGSQVEFPEFVSTNPNDPDPKIVVKGIGSSVSLPVSSQANDFYAHSLVSGKTVPKIWLHSNIEYIFDGALSNMHNTNGNPIDLYGCGSVKWIGQGAFYNSGLGSTKNADWFDRKNLLFIGNRAFYNNYNLTNLYLPLTVEHVGEKALASTPKFNKGFFPKKLEPNIPSIFGLGEIAEVAGKIKWSDDILPPLDEKPAEETTNWVDPSEPIYDTTVEPVPEKGDEKEGLIPAEEYAKEDYKQLKEFKSFRSWGHDSFVEQIRKNNLTNLDYTDEAANVKQEAPFNKKAKRSNVMYQLTVYSFADGNNDGIGDFWGLKDELDYFTDLGIDTLYLSPIHPSSSYHGYDVIDYTDVAPELGGMEAFDAFMKAAHEKGIRVVMDMVFNHTSYEHPWFQEALKGNPEYKDFYYLYDSPSGCKEGYDSKELRSKYRNVYNSEDPSKNPEPSKYFWVSEFGPGMPDLNLSNPKVQEQIADVHKFWAAKGVDGFRYDAFYHYFEESLTGNNNKPHGDYRAHETLELFQEWRKIVESQYILAEQEGIDRSSLRSFMFGEWWKDPRDAEKYWGTPENPGLSSVIDGERWKYKNDVFMKPYDSGYGTRDGEYHLKEYLNKDGQNHEWMPFLDNHDVERWITHLQQTALHQNVYATPNVLDPAATSAYEYALFSLLSRGGLPTLYDGNELLMHGGLKANNPDTYVREAFYWKDMRRRVFFKDERSPGDIISTKGSAGNGFVEDIMQKPDSSFNKVKTIINARKDNESMRDGDKRFVCDVNEVLYVWNNDAIKYNEMTLRKNDDGTYVLIIYSWGDRGKCNTSFKSNYEVQQIYATPDLQLAKNPGDASQYMINGGGINRLGIYKIIPPKA